MLNTFANLSWIGASLAGICPQAHRKKSHSGPLTTASVHRLQGKNRYICLSQCFGILKTQLRHQNSFSLLKKILPLGSLHLSFYGFLRSSKFAIPNVTWENMYMESNCYSILMQQSKNWCILPGPSVHYPCFSQIHMPRRQFGGQVPEFYRSGPLFHVGCFNSLT